MCIRDSARSSSLGESLAAASAAQPDVATRGAPNKPRQASVATLAYRKGRPGERKPPPRGRTGSQKAPRGPQGGDS
eukprot:1536117-Pyramimonas_sp.AAC.1